jgi:acyl-CoA synthetase (AMP-forming)/AMP-acid ligase II
LSELEPALGGDPDAPAVHFGDRTVTVAELHTAIGALADELTAVGVEPGMPVGVMLDDGPDVITALFAVWRIGAVYVPINPRFTDREIDHVCASTNPVAIITTDDAANIAIRATSGPSHLRHDPDIALVQFTSGTTGRPKAVLLRHSGVVSLLDRVIANLRPAGNDTGSERRSRPPMPNLVPVSLSLWAGIYQVLFAFRIGAPVVVLGSFTPKAFVDAVQRHQIRSTVLPPAAMTMLSDDETITDLAPLRYVRSISAPLSPLQARRFRDRFGIQVLNGWGQTEIGGEIVGWTGADSKTFGDTKLGSVGRPHPGVSVRAVADDDTDVGIDQPGELWVKTPALSAGYSDGGDLSDRLSPDGWFRTGDVGRVDAEGFVWIEGRVSEMINRGGLKVFPDEVAEVIRMAPGVADVAVVGVPDARLGEVPWAFVVAAGDASVDSIGLETLCREHLAPYKVPVRFESIDRLPRNDIGKVLGGELVALAIDRSTPTS